MMWGEPNTMKALGEALAWCIVIVFFLGVILWTLNGIVTIIKIITERKLEKGDIGTLIMFFITTALSIFIAILYFHKPEY